jgi:hypothetical protein
MSACMLQPLHTITLILHALHFIDDYYSIVLILLCVGVWCDRPILCPPVTGCSALNEVLSDAIGHWCTTFIFSLVCESLLGLVEDRSGDAL